MELKRRERVEVPVWVGAIVTLAGGALFAAGAKGGRRKGLTAGLLPVIRITPAEG